MNAREYLDQARRIDMRINSKIEQIQDLNDIATRISPIYSDMPKAVNSNRNTREDAILSIIDLQHEIDEDVKKLILLKKEIMNVIKTVSNIDERTVLEMRYLCYRRFEEIAEEFGFSLENVFRLHRIALKNVVLPDGIQ